MEDTKIKKTNIGYWEQVLQAPTPAYQELFDAEQKYLIANTPSNSHVLDIGCGEGRNMATLLTQTPHVWGIDNDQQAIDDALENFKDISSVILVKAEAVELPFEEEMFDVVTFLMILPNLETGKQKVFEESARVLKKGGIFILSTFAETALEERLKIYKQIELPIIKIEGTKVIFDESVGAHVSEQFSLDELVVFGADAGFTLVDHIKVGDIAYICKFEK